MKKKYELWHVEGQKVCAQMGKRVKTIPMLGFLAGEATSLLASEVYMLAETAWAKLTYFSLFCSFV